MPCWFERASHPLRRWKRKKGKNGEPEPTGSEKLASSGRQSLKDKEMGPKWARETSQKKRKELPRSRGWGEVIKGFQVSPHDQDT